MVQALKGTKQNPLHVFIAGRGLRFPVKKEYGWEKFKANISRMAGKGKGPTMLFSEGTDDALLSFNDIKDGMQIEVRSEFDTGGKAKAGGKPGRFQRDTYVLTLLDINRMCVNVRS